jgi:GLPGLI family protein
MKKIILITILLLFNTSFSQKKGLVYYGFIESFNLGNGRGQDANAYIVFNDKMSYYVTAKDSLENGESKYSEKVIQREDGEGGAIYNGIKVSKDGDQVVYNPSKKTMWSSLLYGQEVYVKETTPNFKWIIQKETKKIGKFICRKATTSFRGRTYTAWFAPDVPLPYGPWKFCSLPGLILEVYDTNKNVYWYFKSIEYPLQSKESVKYLRVPKGKKIMNYEEFLVFKENAKQRSIEKSIILKKQFPDATFKEPTLNKMFIECE